MPHIGWRDTIELNFENLTEHGYSPEEIEAVEDRATLFLDTLEASEFGQEHLAKIQEKFGSDTLTINFHHSTEDGWKSDDINLSVDFDWGFLDQRTDTFSEMTMERMMVHELIHAGDPRSPREPFYIDDNHRVATEEYATLETDRFARENMPQLGVRGAYDNAINNDQELNDKLRASIEEAVSTSQDRMNAAAQALEQRDAKISMSQTVETTAVPLARNAI